MISFVTKKLCHFENKSRVFSHDGKQCNTFIFIGKAFDNLWLSETGDINDGCN